MARGSGTTTGQNVNKLFKTWQQMGRHDEADA